MKKSLLIGALALMGTGIASALPTAPKAYPDQYITSISPDGRYVASAMYGSVIITDLETGTEYTYEGDDTGKSYSAGNGNCWSATGILVGATDNNGDPAYWQNGEWKMLPNPDNRSIFMTAITPDGTRAIATAGVIPSDNAPVGLSHLGLVWTLGADNKWQEPVVLPYPKKDFTDRVPQMVLPVCIAEDGKTIIGQMVDYSGFYPAPLEFTLGYDGKWAYAEFGGKLLNPNDRVFPEYPEDAPHEPTLEDFISDPAQKAAYEEAYLAWAESFYDPALYPDPHAYMSDEDIAAYEKAYQEYLPLAQEYNNKLEAFNEVFGQMFQENAMLTLNNVFITPDASKVLMSNTRIVVVDPSDPWGGEVEYTDPMLINRLTNTHESYTIEGTTTLMSSAIGADGTILAYSDEVNRHAFIKKPGKDWERLYDFLLDNAPEGVNRDWYKENICHTFESMDYLTGESWSYVDEPLLGVTACTPDLSVITANIENTWDLENDPVNYYSYVFPTPGAVVGVTTPDAEATSISMRMLKGGVIEVNRADEIFVYDLQGRLVFTAKDACGLISTGLGSGVYTLKAINNTEAKVVKAII